MDKQLTVFGSFSWVAMPKTFAAHAQTWLYNRCAPCTIFYYTLNTYNLETGLCSLFFVVQQGRNTQSTNPMHYLRILKTLSQTNMAVYTFRHSQWNRPVSTIVQHGWNVLGVHIWLVFRLEPTHNGLIVFQFLNGVSGAWWTISLPFDAVQDYFIIFHIYGTHLADKTLNRCILPLFEDVYFFTCFN